MNRRIKPPNPILRKLAIFLSVCGVFLIIGGLLIWLNHALIS